MKIEIYFLMKSLEMNNQLRIIRTSTISLSLNVLLNGQLHFLSKILRL